jgi:hypothetical protein
LRLGLESRAAEDWRRPKAETRAHDCIRQREQGRRSAALTAGSDDVSRAADVEDLGEGGVESGVDPVGVEDPGEEGGVDPSRLSSRNGARRASQVM